VSGRRFASSVSATAALAASTTVAFVWALSVRENLLPSPRNTTIAAGQSMTALAVADTTPDDLMTRAEERDPFATHPTDEPPQAKKSSPIVDAPILRVLGTVVDSAGASFALCQLGAASPVILHVGQRLGDYELRRVERASATFFTPDGGRVERRVPRAGA
jgi:hypothetical protein